MLVTRGDVDLEPILATLPYEDVVVWNNAERPFDAKTYGRFCAIEEAKNEVVYFQDRLPTKSATSTDSTGSALIFNVPAGSMTVTANHAVPFGAPLHESGTLVPWPSQV